MALTSSNGAVKGGGNLEAGLLRYESKKNSGAGVSNPEGQEISNTPLGSSPFGFETPPGLERGRSESVGRSPFTGRTANATTEVSLPMASPWQNYGQTDLSERETSGAVRGEFAVHTVGNPESQTERPPISSRGLESLPILRVGVDGVGLSRGTPPHQTETESSPTRPGTPGADFGAPPQKTW